MLLEILLSHQRTILGYLTNDIVHSGNDVIFMRKTSTLNRAIQRERVKCLGFPPVSREWQEMVVPESLKMTKWNRNLLILEENIDIGREEKVIVLASKAQLDVMNASDEWYCDGTFEVAQRTKFAQFQPRVLLGSFCLVFLHYFRAKKKLLIRKCSPACSTMMWLDQNHVIRILNRFSG